MLYLCNTLWIVFVFAMCYKNECVGSRNVYIQAHGGQGEKAEKCRLISSTWGEKKNDRTLCRENVYKSNYFFTVTSTRLHL